MLVCLLYLWLVGMGQYVADNDLADEVDRSDRRDLSFFRLGWDWLQRRLTFDDPLPDIQPTNFRFMPDPHMTVCRPFTQPQRD